MEELEKNCEKTARKMRKKCEKIMKKYSELFLKKWWNNNIWENSDRNFHYFCPFIFTIFPHNFHDFFHKTLFFCLFEINFWTMHTQIIIWAQCLPIWSDSDRWSRKLLRLASVKKEASRIKKVVTTLNTTQSWKLLTPTPYWQ